MHCCELMHCVRNLMHYGGPTVCVEPNVLWKTHSNALWGKLVHYEEPIGLSEKGNECGGSYRNVLWEPNVLYKS